jgi:ribokinase
LRDYKIDTTGISQQKKFQNGKCLILLRKDGERTILVVLPKNKKYLLNKTQEKLLFNSSYIYSTITDVRKLFNHQKVINEAILHGAKLVLDIESPSIETKEDLEIIRRSSLIFMNQMAFEKMETIIGKEALNQLQQIVPLIVITKGREGSVIYRNNDIYKISALPTEIVDTTGAGDTYNASFLFGLSKGWELSKCGHFASAAASEKIARFGPRSGVRPLEDIIKRLESENQLNSKE